MRPTPRAQELAEPITGALQQVRAALTPPAALDPSTSTRNFTVAAADNADFALALVGKRLSEAAPHAMFDIISLAGAATAYSMLDEGSVDVAVALFRAVPKRFSAVSLYWERYVCIADRDHPELADGLTLERLAALPHLAVTRDAGMDECQVLPAAARYRAVEHQRSLATARQQPGPRGRLAGRDAATGQRLAGVARPLASERSLARLPKTCAASIRSRCGAGRGGRLHRTLSPTPWRRCRETIGRAASGGRRP